ncbi:MAG: hypothetical protein GX128_09320 [Bacteroidales bacterium]|nr:hypothetical protein [Bacteroidales bacterium]
MNRELVFLRTFAIAAVMGMIFIVASSMKNGGNQKFSEIDVERINIVEKDGTIKMIITNVEHFPSGNDMVNGKPTNANREKTAGMLFFNDDGMEAGGLVYSGEKNDDDHVAGAIFTFDQYDGDQVVNLIMQDIKQGDNRFVLNGIGFNDRLPTESISTFLEKQKEFEGLSPEEIQSKVKEYSEQGMIGGVTRVFLGKAESQHNGLFLFDDRGMPRAMFYVDKENNAVLKFFDEELNVIASFP